MIEQQMKIKQNLVDFFSRSFPPILSFFSGRSYVLCLFQSAINSFKLAVGARNKKEKLSQE